MIQLTLLRSTQAGDTTGDTDAFLDLPQGETLVVHAPPSDLEDQTWDIKGARFFKVDASNVKKSKDAAMAQLENPSLPTFEAVFLRANGKPKKLPDGIIVTISTDGQLMTVTDNGPGKANYEFLVWIQAADNDQLNDYVDPGVRNNWS